VLRDRHWTTLLFAHPTNNELFVQDYGELEGSTGYWAANEETGQKGFVQEFADMFGSMMKPRMPGLPGISKADAD